MASPPPQTPPKTVELTRERDVFVLTLLGTPDGAGNFENRFNPTFIEEINLALDVVEAAPVGAALITTSRGKFYGNGLDLKWLFEGGGGAEEGRRTALMHDFQHLLARMIQFPVPTVAAINGHCFAGAFFFALCHDHRVMRTGKGFACMNEIHIDMPLGEGLNSIVLAKVADANLRRDMACHGRRYSGEAAEAAGLVDRAVELGALMPEALWVARSVAAIRKSNAALHAIKRELYRGAVEALERGLVPAAPAGPGSRAGPYAKAPRARL